MILRLAEKSDLSPLKKMYEKIIENMNQNGIKIWDDIYPCEFFREDIDNKRLYLLIGEEEIADAFALCEKNSGEDQEIIKFGAFKIHCFYTPGHSDCSLLFVINNQYVHFGDLYIKMDDGREVLPYVSWTGVEDHLKSFDRMKDHQDKTILISHGLCPVKKEGFILGIKDHETYLQALLKSNNEIPAKEAVEGCKRPFEMMKWREAVR